MRHACFLIGSSFGKQLLGLRHNLVNVANLMRNGLRKYSTQEKDNYSPCRIPSGRWSAMTTGHTFQQGFPGKISIAISQFANSFVKFHHFPTWNLDMVSEIGKSFCQDNWWTPRRPAILSSIADINGHNSGEISSVIGRPCEEVLNSGLGNQDFQILIRTSQS